jgi:hypothetical protein
VLAAVAGHVIFFDEETDALKVDTFFLSFFLCHPNTSFDAFNVLLDALKCDNNTWLVP